MMIVYRKPGMAIYDPCCGSAGLLIKCQLVLADSQPPSPLPPSPQVGGTKGGKYAPLQLYEQEYTGDTWAMGNMNMIIHDMEGKIEIGDSFRYPKFKQGGKLAQFDRVVANPMWNQNWFTEKDYDGDEWGRFPQGAGFPGSKADWGWVQHIWASMHPHAKSAIVLDTGAASRGSGNANKDKEKDVRKWFVEKDIIEGVIYLPENLFYNTSAPGIILILNKAKPEARKHQLLLINASLEFAKGDPKNYISDEGINRIVTVFLNWEEQDKFSRIVSQEEIAKNDYNISPSRYIHVAEAEEFRPISEILQELEELESQAEKTNRVLMQVLSKFR